MSFGGGSKTTPYTPPGPPDPNVGKNDLQPAKIVRRTPEEVGNEPNKSLLSGATPETEEDLRRRANPNVLTG